MSKGHKPKIGEWFLEPILEFHRVPSSSELEREARSSTRISLL